MDTDRYERKMARMQARLERRRHRSGSGGLVVGAVIVMIGVILLLENLGLLHAAEIWRYWPVALIAIGVARILESQRPSALLWGGLLAGIGTFILLDNLDIFVIDFRLIWPLILIAFGVAILLRGIEQKSYVEGQAVSLDPTVSLRAVFSGGRRRIDSSDFKGGDAFALFGGFEIDLRGARIPAGRALFDANVIFGGCEIKVPETWRVNVQGSGIFGGFEDKTVAPRDEDGVTPPELIVTGMALFGGISVRN
jgi:predicted membrane protein